MKKKYIVFGLCSFLFFSLLILSKRFVPVVSEVFEISFSDAPELKDIETKAFLHQVAAARKCIVKWAAGEVGLRERTNRNDHRRINEYFSNIGFKGIEKKPGSYKAYCGAFAANAWLNCIPKVPFVKTPARLASVDGWRNDGRAARIEQKEAEPGDVVSFSLHRHVELVYERHPNPTFKFFTSIGGNTSAPPGEADTREGVHKKTRMWSEIQAVVSLKKTMQMI